MERAPRLRNALLARIARLGARSGRAPGRSPGTHSVRDIPRPPPLARRCIVKARFVPMTPRGVRAAALHLSYIERDGVERDGSPGQLYGAYYDETLRDAISAPIVAEKRQFRFIVSPEDAREVDLMAFTRKLMSQMEADLGRRLVWAAVNHWNTENPHVHVVVRGVDRDGHDLTIDGRYIGEGLRFRAQALLTNELGPRTSLQIEDQLAREVGQDGFTSLDRVLQARCSADGTLVETSLPARDRAATGRLIARLGHLERLGLVARVSAVEWRLERGWDATLRELGQAGDIIKRMHAAVTSPDPGRLVIVDDSVSLDPIAGVVRAKGLHDELTGQPFAVIETVDGRICYAQIDVRTAERVGEGDVVRFAVTPPPRATPTGAAQKAARATPRPWIRVQRLGPPLRLQQRYRGPTWLDGEEAASFATSGSALAPEIARSRAQRDTNLRAMGVPSAPSDRVAALERIEARTLADRLVAERGLRLADPSQPFLGRLAVSRPLPSGRRYAVVTDDVSRQLLVLPDSGHMASLVGHEVRVTRDRDGRLTVSRPPGRAPTRQR